ncbi:hypothetical protein FBU30_011093 [Linnemannia zychae]|nr:hypothetical protein FBU30_011093 [Linnemannia zychae]
MTKIPLKRKWTLWHDKYVANASSETYTKNLKAIAESDSSFWSVYNNTVGPEKLGLKCSLHFMHKGIKPLWEDPQNEHGGAWIFRIDKAYTPMVWRELLMALIGEQFEDIVASGDEIFGLSVSGRWSTDIFHIWNKESSLKDNSAVMEKVTDIMGSIDSLKEVKIQSPYYKAHKDHDNFSK